jgi:hypothetical protein
MSVKRMTLRRADGRVYLDRWGFGCSRGGIYLHRMEAPDPGLDLHDHPWAFLSLVLAGGYTEERCAARVAREVAETDDWKGSGVRGDVQHRSRWSIRRLRLDECHRVTRLDADRTCWTIVLRGPRRRIWGFYTPDGFVDEDTYDRTVRMDRRDLWLDNGPVEAMLATTDEQREATERWARTERARAFGTFPELDQ